MLNIILIWNSENLITSQNNRLTRITMQHFCTSHWWSLERKKVAMLNTILKNLLIRWTLHIEIQGLAQEDINHSIKGFRKEGDSLWTPWFNGGNSLTCLTYPVLYVVNNHAISNLIKSMSCLQLSFVRSWHYINV